MAAGVRYKWFNLGDISSSAIIVFDNLTNMAIISFLLTVVFGMPTTIILKHIIPGLSVGVVIGNLAFIYFAFRLAKKLGRNNITAFPSGLDAPTCIGLTLAVVGPLFLLFKNQGMPIEAAAIRSWHISCACTFFIGLVKFIISFFARKIKNALPTIALLGGLSGVAVSLIAFFPLLSMLSLPLISFFVLAIIIMIYFAGYRMPGDLPAILIAIILGTLAYYILQFFLTGQSNLPSLNNLQLSIPIFSLSFLSELPTAVKYFPIAFPFALLVVFGSVSVAESATVLGEEYSPRNLLLLDGVATMLMGAFGGTAQTTPYAGFPAYKKMNARAGYLLINIIIVGVGAWIGGVNYFVSLIPDAVLAPVLVFLGIEIAMQVFLVCEKKYFSAAIFALFPSIARMVEIKITSNPELVPIDKLTNLLYVVKNGKFSDIAAVVILGNGFIVTGTLWAALIYYLIERKIGSVLITCLLLAICSLCGIIHSIKLDGSMYWFMNLPKAQQIIPLELAGGYLLFAVVAFLLYLYNSMIEKLEKLKMNSKK